MAHVMMAQAGLFNQGRPMTAQQLMDRRKLCYEHFLTRPMEVWARNHDQLRLTLALNEDQFTQFMQHLHRNCPAMEERINFYRDSEDQPMLLRDGDRDANPADRHFQVVAQRLLRELHGKKYERDEENIRQLYSQNQNIKYGAIHLKEERTFRQVKIWWDCYNAMHQKYYTRLTPDLLFDEEYLMFELMGYLVDTPRLQVDRSVLAANMWVYDENKIAQYQQYYTDAWSDRFGLIEMIRSLHGKHLGHEIEARQDKMDRNTFRLNLEQEDENWRKWKSTADEDRISDRESKMYSEIKTARDQLAEISYKLHIQGFLQREFFRSLINKAVARMDPDDEGDKRTYGELFSIYEDICQVLEMQRHIFEKQHKKLKKKTTWFKTKVYCTPNINFFLPVVPAWITAAGISLSLDYQTLNP